MSQWTHVSGVIRVDALRVVIAELTKGKLAQILGPMETYFRDDEVHRVQDITLPHGSEGTLIYSIWENPMVEHLAAYTVTIFGDLRDFGAAEAASVAQWFKDLLKRITAQPFLIRSAILEVAVEYGDTYILAYKLEAGEVEEVGRWEYPGHP